MRKKFLAQLSLSLSLLIALGANSLVAQTLQRSQVPALNQTERLVLSLPKDTEVLEVETGEMRYYQLLEQPGRAQALGGIILLPDPFSERHWLLQTHALRRYLAEQGWLTLVVEPPAPPHRPADALTQGENLAAVTERFQQSSLQRLENALNEFTTFDPDIYIVIAFGRSSSAASRFVTERQNANRPLHLILLDAEELISGDRTLDQYLLEIEGVVIDLHRQEREQAARSRQRLAQRHEVSGYHRQGLRASLEAGWQEEMPWLQRQLRGLIEQQILIPFQEQAERAESAETPNDQRPPGRR
ncbi:DUF3530 family protein [Nitrincola tapanii]|uniref:DUF3530 family protein n=1 Tax=Nitrincola tapanii TaxID=1708751 RepID=A0A5A9VZV9_9GAMM|nr:DUF3530 family protein [Nitrincola tapanii]KAA0874037.1 DUF3530 family protein [Nitrincola tapanii]